MTTKGIKARPVGRLLRLLVGLALVAEGGRHLVGNADLSMMAGGVVLGEFLFYAALHLTLERFMPALNVAKGEVDLMITV